MSTQLWLIFAETKSPKSQVVSMPGTKNFALPTLGHHLITKHVHVTAKKVTYYNYYFFQKCNLLQLLITAPQK